MRENVDGQKESLESLLHRVLKLHKDPMIQWHTFLGFFTKRGCLRPNEKINLQINKKPSGSGLSDAEDVDEKVQELDESFETKKMRLVKEHKQKLV